MLQFEGKRARGLGLLAAAAFAALGLVAATQAASANLPQKPACPDVSSTRLKSTFGFSFATHPTAKRHDTKTLQHLACTYRSDEGDLSIDYDRYSSNKAARARYSSARKALIRQGKREPADTPSQLLPLIKLRAIGDMALRSTDGTVVQFVDGVDFVTLDNGFADISARTVREMVALTAYVDHHG